MTNDIGNEGVNLENNKSGFIQDIEKMPDKIIDILNNGYDLEAISLNAQKKLLGIVGKDLAKMQMRKSLYPEVSICIVTWNRYELLKRCIESIETNTIYQDYNIIVHSNGCTDGTREYLSAAAKINPRIIPILSNTNDVFVIPNNNMMQMFAGNDVILLNNDTMVTRGWLKGLRNAAYSDPDIGIAGSKLLYPDGILQEFGSELYENGTGKNIGKGGNANDPEYQVLKKVGYVSGCSMYIKRSTIEQIGTFDEQFHPCYCEDSDYAYTAWENGIQTVVTPESIVYHDEGGTSGTDENAGFKAYQKENFKKFLNKHGSDLSNINMRIKALNDQ